MHPVSCVMCLASSVMCHVLCVMCLASCVMFPVSYVLRHVSYVLRHVSCVLCPISLRPTAPATDPPHDNSPTMHIRLVLKDQTNKLFVFLRGYLSPFSAKNDNSDNTWLSLRFSEKFNCILIKKGQKLF